MAGFDLHADAAVLCAEVWGRWSDKRMNCVPPTDDELDRYADENQRNGEGFAEVLDAVKDMHTQEGMDMGRGMEHCWRKVPNSKTNRMLPISKRL